MINTGGIIERLEEVKIGRKMPEFCQKPEHFHPCITSKSNKYTVYFNENIRNISSSKLNRKILKSLNKILTF